MSGSQTLTPSGDLIGVEVEKFKQLIVEALDADLEELVIDMTGIAVIDSSGIGTLVAAKNSATSVNTEVVLKGVNSDIVKMFKIMRLTDHFEFRN